MHKSTLPCPEINLPARARSKPTRKGCRFDLLQCRTSKKNTLGDHRIISDKWPLLLDSWPLAGLASAARMVSIALLQMRERLWRVQVPWRQSPSDLGGSDMIRRCESPRGGEICLLSSALSLVGKRPSDRTLRGWREGLISSKNPRLVLRVTWSASAMSDTKIAGIVQ